MPKDADKKTMPIEPEQIADQSEFGQIEIHTIPDKYYGAATRASIEAEKKLSPVDASAKAADMVPKKRGGAVWITVGVIIVLLGSAGGFVYFNQSLIFGEKEKVPPATQPPVPVPPVTPSAPSSPSNLSATATSQTVVQLNWQDTSNNEAGFRIERRDPTTEYVAITSLPPNSSAYQDRTVSAQRDYLYRVIASNEGGDSAPSNETAAQTPAEPPPPPEPVKLPPAGLDTDSDGLTDLEEPIYGTNSNDPDTDHDTFLDGNEVFHLYNPASGVNAKLLDTGIVKSVESPIGWYIYVPVTWKSSVAADGMTATFETGRGEKFMIVMHRNKDRKALMDWYLADHPGVLSTQLIAITTKSGMSGLESENKLHTYFSWDDWILDLQYDLDGQPFVNYRQTYEMMKNSLRLSSVPLISADVIQTYEQREAIAASEASASSTSPMPPVIPAPNELASSTAPLAASGTQP